MDLIIMVVFALCLYLLQGWLYDRFWSRGMEAEICFQEDAAVEGETGYLQEMVINRKFLPLPALHVKFQMDRNLKFLTGENTAVTDLTYRNDVFSVLPWQKITRTLRFSCLKRGYYTCSQVGLVAHDLFLTKSMAVMIPVQTSLYVYPSVADMRQLSIPFYQVLGSVLSRSRLSEDPFEFRGIREYQPYDSMREVNWKATAKTGELKVNVHESTASQKVMLLLNLESDFVWADNALREEAIRIAGSMMTALTEQGISVSLISNGTDLFTGQPIYLDAGAGMEHQRSLLELLSRICYEQVGAFEEVLREQRKEAEMGNTLYLLISSSQREQMLVEYGELCARSPQSVWIAPLRPTDELRADRCLGAVSMKWVVDYDKK